MIAVVLAGMLALATSAPKCDGADISVTDLRIGVLKGSIKKSLPDRVLITADLTNIGSDDQQSHLAQHAELLRNGTVIAKQPLPSLAAGTTYPLQFRIIRPAGTSHDPLEVLVRYVRDDRASGNAVNCTTANDSLQKIF